MNRISVKLKVTLWYTTVMAIVSAVVLMAMTSITREMITRDMKARVVRAVTELSRMANMRGGRHPIPMGGPFYEQGVHMVMYTADGGIAEGHLPFDIEDDDISFEHDKLRESVYSGNMYYEYDRELTNREGQKFWIKGIIPTENELYAIESVTRNNIILTLILIVAAGFGGYLIISRAFIPVNKIRETAEKIAHSNDLSKRINLGGGKDEIHALADTFDEMLGTIENAFERQKQFTSDASHELRTPVAVILSECEYMNTCADTVEEYAESVDSVKRQADKMQKLISELLTISRMDNKTLQVNFEETDISELVDFVCDEQADIHGGGIELIKNISPDVTAYADKFLLARLFINLISNAYQYSNEEGTIEVSLSDEGDNVIFAVTDNGIGIAEEDMPKIWERFYQADPSRSNDSMGLGLSMVKWIAQCHKGNVNVTSTLGEGSRFEFVFPNRK